MSSPLSLSIDGNTAVIGFASAQTLNAIDEQSLLVLPRLVREAGADENVSYIVVQGTPAHFCSGGGSGFLATLGASPYEERVAQLGAGQDWVNSVIASPCMTVAVVEGLATGAGVDFLLAFDVTLLVNGCRISFFYNRLGAIPDLGGLWLLAERLGYQKAMSFYAGGDVLSAEQASLAGFGELYDGVPPQNAREWGRLLSRRYPVERHGYAAAKLSLNDARLAELAAHQEKARGGQATIFGSDRFKSRLARVEALQKLGRVR